MSSLNKKIRYYNGTEKTMHYGNQNMKNSKTEVLLSNIDKLHTTKMGIDRIKKNLNLKSEDIIEYCKNKILNKNCYIYKQGKNWYCEVDNIKITINSYSYTIITAKMISIIDK